MQKQTQGVGQPGPCGDVYQATMPEVASSQAGVKVLKELGFQRTSKGWQREDANGLIWLVERRYHPREYGRNGQPVGRVQVWVFARIMRYDDDLVLTEGEVSCMAFRSAVSFLLDKMGHNPMFTPKGAYLGKDVVWRDYETPLHVFVRQYERDKADVRMAADD